MNPQSSSSKKLFWVAYAFLGLTLIALSALLFLSAGTIHYWQAWVYLAIMLISSSLITQYLLRYSPALLQRRMRMHEKEPRQRWIIRLAWLWLIITFLVPGFDQRYDGSAVSPIVVIAADILVLVGYGICFWVFKENPYASRIVEVEPGQEVITTGPYAIVRHPMYIGSLLIFLTTPLALGSYWALWPAVFIIPILVARIRNEENMLKKNLKGYSAYVKKTRYRLLPRVW